MEHQRRVQGIEVNSPQKLLSGKRILVTRPRHQAATICRLIEGAGGHAIRLALLEIADPSDNTRAIELIRHLNCFDMAIFVSANAVHKTKGLMNALGFGFPSHLKLAAIGKQTANTLLELGYCVDIVPQHTFNSEAFLAMPETQNVKDLNILIFRGVGGRDSLKRGLMERGAIVEYAEVYRRIKPPIADTELRRVFSENKIDLITITSSDALQNFHTLISDCGLFTLLDICLLVGSQRIAERARTLNFTKIRTAADPSDPAMFNEILHWSKNSNRNS